jgi:hypothetical protein
MEIIVLSAFSVLVFAGILILRHMARADLDQWRENRR